MLKSTFKTFISSSLSTDYDHKQGLHQGGCSKNRLVTPGTLLLYIDTQ